MLRRLVSTTLAVLACGLLLAGAAFAVTPGVGLTIQGWATPSNFSAGDYAYCEANAARQNFCADAYRVRVTNQGSVSTGENPIAITDTLPPGVSLGEMELSWSGETNSNFGGECEVVSGSQPMVVQCHWPYPLGPGESLEMVLDKLSVAPSSGEVLTDTAKVSGGGASEASMSVQNTYGGASPAFGMSSFGAFIAGLDGLPDTQAGSHPYAYSNTIDLNNEIRTSPFEFEIGDVSIHDVKDVVADLPLGFLGSALAAPQCTLAQLSAVGEVGSTTGGCPADTRVGNILTLPPNAGGVTSPLYNMVPEHSVAAEFGFIDNAHGAHVLDASVVPTPKGYVLRTTSASAPQFDMAGIQVALFGNPAVADRTKNTPVAMFTNPSDCDGEPLTTSVHIDSWQNPGSYNADGTPNFSDPNWVGSTSTSPPVTGCDELHFTGSVTAQPETTAADSPTGVNVEIKIPQSEAPESLATPPLRDTVVTLPAGLSINPSQAGGLQACSEAQIALGTNDQPGCPEASKIGTVEVSTPTVGGVLQGSVYLAAQNENPFHTLLAMYVVVDDPTTGVLIKLPGRIDTNPTTGQITTTFTELPQFPVGDLKLHLFGGARAPLTTPESCGTYTTSSTLTPWSAPDSGPPASSSDSFQIDSGCVSGFAPSFNAGTVNNQAGGFSPLSVTFSRTDQDQNLSGVTVTTPPGVLGILKGVERCPEPQASQGTCGQGSLIGHTTVAAGTGPDPFWVQGGQVFLTGPYKGAPFGLSIVVPAVAGPFNLGNVVVRAAISIDPHTAQITVSSDPLPTILQGIPLQIRTVNVSIDRSGFTFNPTSCEPLTVNGTLSSTQGATAAVSSRFQAANCANLSFKPVFSVSTQAGTSKKNGASLVVRGAFPAGEANIHSVAVTLPKQLPARLTTIQQACTEVVFNANPANCPSGSNIGTATASTPILANPVVGPVYLVSHGGAAFPDVVAILQGEGVTVDLVGSIDIKHNITSSTFASVPDAPIASFALTLPEGPHSGLAAVVSAKAKGSLCGQALSMPFTITGQNGAVVKQPVKIVVTGCPKAKKKSAKRKTKTAKHGGKKG